MLKKIKNISKYTLIIIGGLLIGGATTSIIYANSSFQWGNMTGSNWNSISVEMQADGITPVVNQTVAQKRVVRPEEIQEMRENILWLKNEINKSGSVPILDCITVKSGGMVAWCPSDYTLVSGNCNVDNGASGMTTSSGAGYGKKHFCIADSGGFSNHTATCCKVK